jgi:tetratricopeptide (TPR) repeat protein
MPDGVPGAERDAKIEQLLLLGLDYYFAADYDQAINVWTRALFLDRSHPRARAYIERARSALAERQRQSEELLHHGVDAFQRGEGDEARRLVQAAIDGGVPSDQALAVLDRFNRLEPGAVFSQPTPLLQAPHQPAPDAALGPSRAPRWVAVSIGTLLAVAMVGSYAASSRARFEWQSLVALWDAPARKPVATVARDQSLPLPRRGEMALSRARALAASGHLHEALATLDLVRVTDPQIVEAERLRGGIQRQLVTLSSATAPESSARAKGDGGTP